MRINSVYISAFGGIKNLQIDLKDGFNVIYGDNENGKTTLMSFIKMMFYGSGRGSAQISKNIRKKYTPWDSSQMAGSITFEHENRNYKLEREFWGSDSKDKVTLYDLDLGTRESIGSEPGMSFFGLSAAAFERSVFIGQFGFPESNTEAEGELNSKLSNIALTGDETVSFEKVNARLEKAKNSLMSKSGRTGEYDKNLRLSAELKDRIIAAESAKEQYESQKSAILRADAEIKRMLKKSLEIKEKISAEQDIRNAEKYKELLATKAELDNINSQLKLNDGSIINENYIRKLQLCISKSENIKTKADNKQKEIDMLKSSLTVSNSPEASEEALGLAEREITNLSENLDMQKSDLLGLQNELLSIENKAVKSGKGLIGIVIGLILLIIALGVYFASPFKLLSIPIAVLGIVSVVLGIIGSLSQKKSEQTKQENIIKLNREISDAQNQITKINNDILLKKVRLEAIKTALNTNASVIEKQHEMLKKAEDELKTLESQAKAEENQLKELFSLYKQVEKAEEISDYIEEISEKTALQKTQRQKLNYILNDLNGISYELAAEKLEKIKTDHTETDIDFDALKAQYEGLLNSITEAKAKLSADAAKAKAEIDAAENPDELKTKLKEIINKAEDQKQFCLAIDIASEILTESFAEVRRSFGSAFEKRAGEILSGITGRKYNGMNISKSFDIAVSGDNSFVSREIDYLSSGTADQAYLSLRLALTELICEEKVLLPILMDDSLSQYDDGRVDLALEFLAEYSKNGQVLMFTCHNHIYETAGSKGANLINLV